MKKDFLNIGKSFPIQDAEMKVTGEQIYVADMVLPGMLHAKLVFSSVPHGRVTEFRTEEAMKIPGVVKIYFHENTPGDLYNNYAFFVDQPVPLDERMFTDTPRYVGDCIGAVVADTKLAAEKAARLIKVKYEVLPSTSDMLEALENPDIKIKPDGNLLKEMELNFGNAEEAIAASDLVFTDSMHTKKIHHAAMETHGVLADCDRYENITIWTPCQSVFGVRATVADLLKVPYNKLRVVKTVMGGSFGGKQHAVLEQLAAYMARDLKKPVSLILNREETILSTLTRTATRFQIKTAVSENGYITGSMINGITDAGAYVGNTNDLSIAMGKKAFRVYRIPNLNYKVKGVLTNTPIAGGCRGWGGPQICTAIEVHFDSIAKKMNMDPGEFRMKNLVHPYDMENVTKITLGNARVRECLSEGMEEFSWKERKAAEKGSGRYKRGVGLACGGHVNGFYGKIQDLSSMILKMNEDGTFILNTGTHDQGCGTLISLAQIVGEVLEVTPERVAVLEADTHSSPYDLGTFSSRVTYVAGKCAFNVAKQIREQILATAASIFNVSVNYIQLKQGYVWVLGQEDKRISYRELATIAQVKLQKDIVAVEKYSNVSNPGSYGAHFAEVEVDTYTGMVKVLDYLAVHDIGQIINAGMVEGQVLGCVQMGIGMALCEEMKFDEKGKPLNSSFAKYTLINAPDMPKVRCKFLEFGEDDGPFGAKSIGEIAVIPVAGAIINAVNDALGTEIREVPMSPEKIVEAICMKEEA